MKTLSLKQFSCFFLRFTLVKRESYLKIFLRRSLSLILSSTRMLKTMSQDNYFVSFIHVSKSRVHIILVSCLSALTITAPLPCACSLVKQLTLAFICTSTTKIVLQVHDEFCIISDDNSV